MKISFQTIQILHNTISAISRVFQGLHRHWPLKESANVINRDQSWQRHIIAIPHLLTSVFRLTCRAKRTEQREFRTRISQMITTLFRIKTGQSNRMGSRGAAGRVSHTFIIWESHWLMWGQINGVSECVLCVSAAPLLLTMTQDWLGVREQGRE